MEVEAAAAPVVTEQAPAAAEIKKIVAAEKDVEDTTAAADTKSPAKEESAKNISTLGDHKKNGVSPVTPVKDDRSWSGIVVQLPEMFSLKRDAHILDKLSKAADVRAQKIAFVECSSEEAAVALQAKLNNTSANNKRLSASRMDITEKNALYIGALKSETTDEMIKEGLSGVQQIIREKYNAFVLFTSETECRAARTKVTKEGINGQSVRCDFDLRSDRFKPAEEPKPKKAKEEEEPAVKTEEVAAVEKETDKETEKDASVKKEEEEAGGEEETEEAMQEGGEAKEEKEAEE